MRPACGTDTTTGPLVRGRLTAMAAGGMLRVGIAWTWQKKRDESSVARQFVKSLTLSPDMDKGHRRAEPATPEDQGTDFE
ncbi:protein of unknown function [uncultured Sphingopyxis sp.]|uniref:Uncharacterized protein n=2 Tax=uncultured Sphingopyxis sp. TaxID=310581 RepID=A0A1Y5Q116_9SPHN|nr:protein of unknown function [uncultured Sphingopyxis sp.]